MLDKRIPLWTFLLVMISTLILAVLFAWAAKSKAQGSDRFGWVGQAAFEVASFPGTAKDALVQIYDGLSGGVRDENIRVPRYESDAAGFEPVETADGVLLEGLVLRADAARLEPGWRVLAGAFAWDGDFLNGAVLLSPDLRAVHFWPLGEDDIGGEVARPPFRKLLHGVEVLPDASVIYSFDGGISLQRVGQCGESIWQIAGEYHHAVDLSEDGETAWSLRENDLVQVAVATGEILNEISLEAIVEANPLTDVLEIRRLFDNEDGGNSRGLPSRWMFDPMHLNDISALPPSMAGAYDDFEAGDLLVSVRSLNLVYILDPESLEIKWWRSGSWKRQHDPDWQPNGEITVLDNQMNHEFSRIVSIDPATFETRTLLDGTQYDFYTRIRGKHQILPNGNLLVASAQQGRAFEVAPDGEIVFEALNFKAKDDAFGYVISEAIWLPPDALSLNGACP